MQMYFKYWTLRHSLRFERLWKALKYNESQTQAATDTAVCSKIRVPTPSNNSNINYAKFNREVLRDSNCIQQWTFGFNSLSQMVLTSNKNSSPLTKAEIFYSIASELLLKAQQDESTLWFLTKACTKEFCFVFAF